MNIVEAYIKFNSQLIILISGFSGSGKTLLGRNIQRDFKLQFINLNDYYKEDYNNVVDLGHDIKVIDWDHPDAIDWDKFNEKINSDKTKGVVCVGFGFPEDRIKFTPDFHIRLDIPKPRLLEMRHKYLDENKDNKLNEYKDSRTELLIMNKLSYPHHEEIKVKSKYTHKFSLFDKENLTLDEIPDKMYDDAFDYLINQIEKKIYKK
jgi:adenylate kinase family enzyme